MCGQRCPKELFLNFYWLILFLRVHIYVCKHSHTVDQRKPFLIHYLWSYIPINTPKKRKFQEIFEILYLSFHKTKHCCRRFFFYFFLFICAFWNICKLTNKNACKLWNRRVSFTHSMCPLVDGPPFAEKWCSFFFSFHKRIFV